MNWTPASAAPNSVAPSSSKRRPERAGASSSHPVAATATQSTPPQGTYRTTGDDDWLALTVRDEPECYALCSTLGRDDWRTDPSLASPWGRHARHDELDAAITEWTVLRDHGAAAQLLQDAGVPAAPVYANYELVTDSHLHQRQFYIPIDHPEAGVLSFAGFPWSFGPTPAEVRRPAPCFAEHNGYVFGELLGLSAQKITRLEADQITARVPGTGPVIRVTN